METTVDVALVRAARSGDSRARDELVAAYLPLVYNVVHRALPGDPEVDDVVQETMLRAVRGLPDLRDPARFRAWLVTTAIRQVRDHAREQRARSSRRLPLDALDDASDPAVSVAEDAVDRVTHERESHDLLDAARWLTPDERQVLALWWQEVNGELTRAEVADALALSPQHTAVRVQRMRERLLLARAVVRAWRAAPRCRGLAEVGRGWSGGTDGRWFKRLARHVRGCPTCAVADVPRDPSEHAAVAIGVLALPTGLAHRAIGRLPLKAAVVASPALVAAVAFAVWITATPADQPPEGVAIPSAVLTAPPSDTRTIHTAHGFDDHISLVGRVRVANLQVNRPVEARHALYAGIGQRRSDVTQ